MAVSPDERARIKREITDWLRAGGGNVDSFGERFPSVPKSTLYRWVASARVAVGREEARKALQAAQALREAPGSIPGDVADVLPVPVGVDSLMPVSGTNALQLVQEAIVMARRTAEHCQAEGRIKNLKGFQQAARLLLSSVDTLCRVAERLHDVQRVERFHAAMIDEIAAESPEVAQRIIARLRRLNEVWGV